MESSCTNFSARVRRQSQAATTRNAFTSAASLIIRARPPQPITPTRTVSLGGIAPFRASIWVGRTYGARATAPALNTCRRVHLIGNIVLRLQTSFRLHCVCSILAAMFRLRVVDSDAQVTELDFHRRPWVQLQRDDSATRRLTALAINHIGSHSSINLQDDVIALGHDPVAIPTV